MKDRKRFQKGFTLIENLIVLAVIAALIGIALPRFKGIRQEGDIAKAKGELRTLQTAIESYYMHNNNTYPATTSAALQIALTAAVPNIIASVPVDPFSATGALYQYVMGGTNNKYFIVYSVGPGGNGSAVISVTNTVTETNGPSCIYASNMSTDTQP